MWKSSLWKRSLGMVLVLVLVASLMPVSAFPSLFSLGDDASRAVPEVTGAHEDCGAKEEIVAWSSEGSAGARAVSVRSIEELKAALKEAGVEDIVLAPEKAEAEWQVSETLAMTGTKHVYAAEGKTVILKRQAGFSNALVKVGQNQTLILGDGVMRAEPQGTYRDEEGKEKTLYTYKVEKAGGEMILDGGASWEKQNAFTPGTYYDENTHQAVFYDLEGDGSQYFYQNTGLATSSSLIRNQGSLSLWDGVTLENNMKINNSQNGVNYGSAINCQVEGNEMPSLTMYGGLIQRCVTAGSGDNGQGAVYIGKNGSDSFWETKPGVLEGVVFNMYGGQIINNANGRKNGLGNPRADGGGVAMDQATMNLYGGEISYNCAGLINDESGASDGGGIMVRCGSVLNMYGGEVSHNFAGGYGGGIVAWNGDVNLYAGSLTENRASFGGGIGIASYDSATSKVNMYGGLVAYNEAIGALEGGYGGGLCAGSGNFTMGAHLNLTGGTIRQNKAANGGGVAAYAGGGQNTGNDAKTEMTLSGDFALTGNSATYHGNGMYLTNVDNSGNNPNNTHPLITLSGGARIDTNNPVYFENLCFGQVPVQVSGELTTAGTAAIFQFSDGFWKGSLGNDYAGAEADLKIIAFGENDIQENKIALESTEWYLNAQDKGLALQKFADTPLYTIRNDTPIKVEENGTSKKYYRLYSSLDDAFNEAADGDTLYIFYNTTIDVPAVLEGKKLSLLAESNYSTGMAGDKVTTNKTTTFSVDTRGSYNKVEGDFLKYVGPEASEGAAGEAERYEVNKETNSAEQNSSGAYVLDVGAGNDFSTTYNVRNDYTITLANSLYLGESSRTNTETAPEASGAIVVKNNASLDVGKAFNETEGTGRLTFDGNLSYPTEGPMFQAEGALRFHSGITVRNHSNYSQAHPGAIEVLWGGSLAVNEGVSVTGNVSPVAGGVYVASGGSFILNGGTLSENTGAMPRYGFNHQDGSKVTGFDTAYWGQPKYYHGAGAVFNAGTFTMESGVISGNRGEYGAVANSGVAALKAGEISGNHALTLTGEGSDDPLGVTGYTEGTSPAIPAEGNPGAGYGGGVYAAAVSGGSVTLGAGMSLSQNTAMGGGGGIAAGLAVSGHKSIDGYNPVSGAYQNATTANRTGWIAAADPSYSQDEIQAGAVSVTVEEGASLSANTAKGMGGGVYVQGAKNQVNLKENTTVRENRAQAGGGLAAQAGGSIVFDGNVTENTGVYGGGLYVGGEQSALTAKGNAQITANIAAHGGGAYVDCLKEGEDGSQPADPSGEALGADKQGSAGKLILEGAYVNNNRLDGTGGLGTGMYNRGDLELRASEGVQPFIATNDVIYLEEGHWITAGEEVSLGRNNAASPVMVDSRSVENGTQILAAANPEQALDFLDKGALKHSSYSLARRTGDLKIIEINSHTVTYWTGLPGEESAQSNSIGYTPGASVTILNFDQAGMKEDEPIFALPTGKALSYWAQVKEVDGTWTYVNSQGEPVEGPEAARHFSPGDSIASIHDNYQLVAVYTDVQHRITVEYEDQWNEDFRKAYKGLLGGGESRLPEHLGTVGLDASYDVNTGYMTAYGSTFTITPSPVSEKIPAAGVQSQSRMYDIQGVLQGLNIYQATDLERIPEDGGENYVDRNGKIYELAASAQMETEDVAVTATKNGKEVTQAPGLISTGKIKEMINENQETSDSGANSPQQAKLTAEGKISYTAGDSDILIIATFKQGMVRMDLYPMKENGQSSETGSTAFYTGWYDDMYTARQALIGRFAGMSTGQNGDGAIRAEAANTALGLQPGGDYAYDDIAFTGNNFASELTLLAPNAEKNYETERGENTISMNRFAFFGGEEGYTEYREGRSASIEERGRILYTTWNCNGMALDAQFLAEQLVRDRDITLKQGIFFTEKEMDNRTENPSQVTLSSQNQLDMPNDSLFYIDRGTLRLENMSLETGQETAFFNVRLMKEGVLDLGSGARAGSVSLYTVYNGQNQPDYDASAHVTVSDNFAGSEVDKVASLYLYPGTEEVDRAAGRRYVIKLADDVTDASGHLIRSKFQLAQSRLDTGGIFVEPAKTHEVTDKWFIGTDGRLYKRVAYVAVDLLCGADHEEAGADEAVVENNWNWLLPEEDGHGGGNPLIMNGLTDESGNYTLPLYNGYQRPFGYNIQEHQLMLRARVLDADKEEIINKDENGSYYANAGGSVTFTITRMTWDPDSPQTRYYIDAGRAVTGATATSNITSSTLGNSLTVSNDTFYLGSAVWTGAGQYAPAYAKQWMYKSEKPQQGEKPLPEEPYGYMSGGAVSGGIMLSVDGKPLSDDSVTLADLTSTQGEWIGPAGSSSGYKLAPAAGTVRDRDIDNLLISGTDYGFYFAKLTASEEEAVEGSAPISYNGATYYYERGADGSIQYFTDGGALPAGNESGLKDPKDFNQADAGVYMVGLYAMNGSNYTRISQWKNQIFTIQPYSGSLQVTGPNHVLVGENAQAEQYKDALEEALKNTPLHITDRYGNELDGESCDFSYEAVGPGAKVENNLPVSPGLYNLVVHPKENQTNYASQAAGYLPVLITNSPLRLFVLEDSSVTVPYTGSVYTESGVEAYDGDLKEDGRYQVWLCQVNEKGEPVDESGNVIKTGDIPTQGAERKRLMPEDYTLSISTPQQTPLDAGSYFLMVSDISGEHTGVANLRIVKTDLVKVQLEPEQMVYSGRYLYPALSVFDDKDQALVRNQDYTVSVHRYDGGQGTEVAITAPRDAGVYHFHPTGINNYEGSISHPEQGSYSGAFTVVPKMLDNSDVSPQEGPAAPAQVLLQMDSVGILTGEDSYLTGVNMTLSYNGARLSLGTDYDVDYYRYDPDNASNHYLGEKVENEMLYEGDYVVVITGKGNYQGSLYQNYKLILPQGGEDNALVVSGGGNYVYNAGTFADYTWKQDSYVSLREENAGIVLDPGLFTYELYHLGSAGALEKLPDTQKLNVGSYAVKVSAPLEDPTKAPLTGWGTFTITPRPVHVTVGENSKIYGTNDPVYSYETDLKDLAGEGTVDPATGFFEGDAVSGSFDRAPGEDAVAAGYGYTMGSFSAGSNYVITLAAGSNFRIQPKEIGTGEAKAQDIACAIDQQAPYTGYAVDPVKSVVYQSQRGDLQLREGRDYVLTYERWDGEEKTDNEGNPTGTYWSPQEQGAKGIWTGISAAPSNVGWYRVRVDAESAAAAPDNYSGSFREVFQIVQSTSELTIQLQGRDREPYKGEAYTPGMQVQAEGSTLNSSNYTLTYTYTPFGGKAQSMGAFQPGSTELRNAGTYTIYATGRGNYNGASGSADFTILQKDLSQTQPDEENKTQAVQIDLAQESFVYNGGAQEADVTAAYGGLTEGGLETAEALQKGKDFTLAYRNHTNAGEATVVITGMGNYTGSRELTYHIDKQPLLVTVENTQKLYGENDPVYTYQLETSSGGAVEGVTLTGSVMVDPSEGEYENVGDYGLVLGSLSAGNNYTLSLKAEQKLTVSPKPLNQDGEGKVLASYISVSAPQYVGTETSVSQIVSSVTYWAPGGQRTLGLQNDYEVTVENEAGESVTGKLGNGTYTVTIQAKEDSNYTGSYTFTVTAVDADSLINLTKDEGKYVYRPGGYDVKLEPGVTGNSQAPLQYTVTPNATAFNGRNLQGTTGEPNAQNGYIVHLSEAGTYTFTVTATTGEGDSQKLYYGTVTYVVHPKSIEEGDTLGAGEVTNNPLEGEFGYTGGEIRPENENALLNYGGNTVYAEEEGKVINYILSYSNNVNPGEATLTLTGMGNYTGAREIKYTIGDTRYRVFYDLNEGTGTPPRDASLYMAGDPVTVLTAEDPVKGPEGQNTVFVGWSETKLSVITSEDQLGQWYRAGSGFNMPGHDVTLYAIWAADQNQNGKPDYNEDRFTVTYEKGDGVTGTAPSDNGSYAAGDTVTIRGENAMVHEGYALLGWSQDAPESGIYKIDNMDQYRSFIGGHTLYPPSSGATFIMPAGDVTLYAVWAQDRNKNGVADWMENNQVFVYYSANGGAGSIDPEIIAVDEEGTQYTVKSQRMSREGAVQVGWTLDKAYKGFVSSPDQLQDHTFAPAADEAYGYYAFGSVYRLRVDAEKSMIVFHALWAEDQNRNGTADYEETEYRLTYQALQDGPVQVQGDLPRDGQAYLKGQSAVVQNLGDLVQGTYQDGEEGKNAVFLGWTTDPNKAAALYSRENRLQSDQTVYQPMQPIRIQQNVTLYPLWGEADYYLSEYTVTASVISGKGNVSPLSQSVLDGGRAEVTFTPEPGWRLTAVTVNGNLQKIEDLQAGADGSYILHLEGVSASQTVVAAFSWAELTLDAPAYQVEYANRSLSRYIEDGLLKIAVREGSSPVESTLYRIFIEDQQAGSALDAGTYLLTVEGTAGGAYAGVSLTVPLTVTTRAIEKAEISEIGSQAWTGQPLTPEMTITDFDGENELTLEKDRDYTLSYTNNQDVGRATVTITGKGNYTGSVQKSFDITEHGVTILPDSGQSKIFGAAEPSYTYKAYSVYTDQEKTEYNGKIEGTLGREPGEAVKTYAFNISGMSAAGAGLTLAENGPSFAIREKSLEENNVEGGTKPVSVSEISDLVYDGSAKTPVPSVTYQTENGSGLLALKAGEDFTVDYKNGDGAALASGTYPTGQGSYLAVLTGKGNYTGTREVPFDIVAAGGSLTMDTSLEKTYNAQGWELTGDDLGVRYNGSSLSKDKDYTVAYAVRGSAGSLTEEGLPLDAGSYTVTVTAKGNYSGKVTGTLTILPAEITGAEAEQTSFTFDNAPHGPEDVTVEAGGLILDEGDYEVRFEGTGGTIYNSGQAPSAAGSYVMRITGKGNFTGSGQIAFTISASGDLAGWQVSPVPDQVYNGLPYYPVLTVTDGKGNQLKLNENYTVTYPSDAPINAGSYTAVVNGMGDYSEEGALPVPYQIVPADLETVGYFVIDEAVYDGEYKTPRIAGTHTLEDGRSWTLIRDVDFEVFYNGKPVYSFSDENFKEPGTYTLTISAVEGGNYTGQKTIDFIIRPADSALLNVALTPQQAIYTGKEQKPAIMVTDGQNQEIASENYEVTYTPLRETGAGLGDSDLPLNAGAYTVAVEGKETYAGHSGTATFVIMPAGLEGTVTVEKDCTYDGSEQKPAVTVTDLEGKPLAQDVDYTLLYTNNVNAGEGAVVTVVGKGNYAGTLNETFTIEKAALMITPTTTEKIYGQEDPEKFQYTAGTGTNRAGYQFAGALTRAYGENAGTYAFNIGTLVETSGNYRLEIQEDAAFTIKPKSFETEAADITAPEELTTGYTGAPWSGTPFLLYDAQLGKLAPVSQEDYTMSFASEDGTPLTQPPAKPGSYIVTVTGKAQESQANSGNYIDSLTFKLVISDSVLSAGFLEANGGVVTYNGEDWTQDMENRLSVYGSGKPLTGWNLLYFDEDGEAVNEITDAGVYTIQVNAQGYEPVDLSFAVLKKELTPDMVTLTDTKNQVYDGTQKKPSYSVLDAGAWITGNDYAVSYGENLNAGAGAGSVTVAAKAEGNYFGKVTKNFDIQPYTLTEDNTQITPPGNAEYNGSVQYRYPQVAVRVKGASEALRLDTDYTLSFDPALPAEAGAVSAAVVGRGNFQGTLQAAVSYEITRRSVNASGITVSVIPDPAVYTGQTVKPAVVITDMLNGIPVTLSEGRDYEVIFEGDPADVGTHRIVINGLGNYTDSREATFRISAAGGARFSIDRIPDATYNGAPQIPALVVKANGKQVAKESYTAQVSYNGGQAKPYDQAGFVDAGVYVITLTGKEGTDFAGFSGSVTYVIRPGTFTLSQIPDQAYTGRPLTPQPQATMTGSGASLIKDKDYVLSWANNLLVGQATVVATGLGNYAGCSQTVQFNITGDTSLFTVTYDGNGNDPGTTPPVDQNRYLAGALATVQDKGDLAKEKAVFLGWLQGEGASVPDVVTSAAQEAGLGTILSPGQTFTVSGNMTLQALWGADENENGRPDYKETVKVTASAGTGGTIEPSGTQTVQWGTAEKVFTIKPQSGYRLDGMKVNGAPVSVSTQAAPTGLVQNQDGSYTFTLSDIKEDYSLIVSFRANSTGGGGGGGGGGGSSEPQPQPDDKPDQEQVADPDDTGVSGWLNTREHMAYLMGYPEGTFAPDRTMTRGEAAQMFYNLLLEKDVARDAFFQDVDEADWYYEAVVTLASQDLIQGVGEGRFEPDRAITRAEFTAMAMNFSHLHSGGENIFSDVSSSDWFYDQVTGSVQYGWIGGYPDGTFRPQALISRSEVAVIVNRMLGRFPDQAYLQEHDEKLVSFYDLPESHWAYSVIMEATNGHSYTAQDGEERWTELKER